MIDRPEWLTEAMRAARDLLPALCHQLDRLEAVYLVTDREDLRIVLPNGHAVPEGAKIMDVLVVHADVPAMMVALAAPGARALANPR